MRHVGQVADIWTWIGAFGLLRDVVLLLRTWHAVDVARRAETGPR